MLNEMTDKFQQYRFARIEGHKITLARLDAHFKNGMTDIRAFERAIAEQLTLASTTSAPWRKSEIQQTGFREGARLAVLEFYWAHRRELPCCNSRLGEPARPQADRAH